MSKKVKWQDDYWLLLMQIYLQKPVGLKPVYDRRLVDLSMELHIAPGVLFSKMCEIANLETPRIEHIWETYGNNPRKLARAARLLRDMKGFNNAEEFYEGVELNESFEKDFKPVAEGEQVTPVMLILVLDLYFHLSPITMVAETPEVQELARLIKLSPKEVAHLLQAFQHCDPYLMRKESFESRFMDACRSVWRRYGNADLETLSSYASQLKDYFK